MTEPVTGVPELSAAQGQPEVIVNALARGIALALGGQITKNFASNANLTLEATAPPTTANEWNALVLKFTDTGVVLTTGRDVIYPNVDTLYSGESRLMHIIQNATLQTLTVKRSGQTGVAVAAGGIALVRHNGTDIVAISAGSGADHGTLTGLSDDDHTQYVLRSILTTNGDMFTRVSGAIARLGIGSAGQVLTVVSGALAWATPSGGGTDLSTLFTTNGDLVRRASGVPARLGIGSTGDVLTVVSGLPAWAAPSGGGDISFTDLNPVGTKNTKSDFLAQGVSLDDLYAPVHLIELVGIATTVTTGTAVAYRTFPLSYRILEIFSTLKTASSSGSVVVNIKKNGTTILGTNKLTIIATEKWSVGNSLDISDFELGGGDEITFDITSAGTGAKGLQVWIRAVYDPSI